MPNWCQNTLSVYGSDKDITSFVSKLFTEGQDPRDPFFGAHVPMPEGEALEAWEQTSVCAQCGGTGVRTDEVGVANGMPERNYCNGCATSGRPGVSITFPGWYAWSVENWGTKWDACEPYIAAGGEEGAGFVTIVFMTAWSPPVAWFRSMVEQEPALNFTLHYSEKGMSFEGEIEIENGAITRVQWVGLRSRPDYDRMRSWLT